MNQPTNPDRQAVDEFAVDLQRHLLRLLNQRYRNRDLAEEVASRETLRFLENPTPTMAKYATGKAYAGVRANHGRSDYFRSNRVQRCEGARLPMAADGTVDTERFNTSGDATNPSTGRSFWESMADLTSMDDDRWADRMTAEAAVATALTGLPADQQYLAVHVLGHDETVVHAAHHLGVARETGQRKLRRAFDAMRVNTAGLDLAA